ncbi:hypothetical protein O9G_006283, partial [Rozella allomycis CSF55]
MNLVGYSDSETDDIHNISEEEIEFKSEKEDIFDNIEQKDSENPSTNHISSDGNAMIKPTKNENLENKNVSDEDQCKICLINKFKYKCPRCSIKTCSLNCVKKHKEQNECSGQLSRTHFIKVSDFTDTDFKRDIDFISQGQCLSSGSLPLPNKHGRKENELMKILKQSNIEIRFMAKGMKKRNRNKTYFARSDKSIYWTVEWLFPSLSKFCIVDRMNENKSLVDLYTGFIRDSDTHRSTFQLLKNEPLRDSFQFLMKKNF